ncbi:nucleoside triphosphate pyrophosphohydrolase ham1 [Orbilia oligospora]|uniref:Inosine triphosphate pyrophosphatase n=1 Tax=Orbilia oligospora TaxID=2813651 RepID=A0A6G1ML38_ORBOL|nr:nucleoside triphosphate pyrophosphohydrolase ham1 [Orbilia oligospora]KAF3211472.1 nucleoside triphosphate pyrophosphohydrolase ham1 [Orbilia oligospora]KAF3211581.1 nucleoside triphosphate pyrophosphohydrolase ham1 [Orbilia oligospora]KAF3226965.1 nucleoside triphosphate pyrophosphohydrolase ham1 [Orbilia oligospora]KAF3261617.1 nucleoside triphosphate pyrophosphohydrolase ham1 [Orbilia oligospora]
MPLDRVTFVTGNAGKLAEVQAILGQYIKIDNHGLDLEEIQGTIEEVSSAKCKKAAEALQGPVLTEDTCLCFNALNGLPGPYIKWFMQGIGHSGLNKLLAGFEDKSAEAVCTFAFSEGPGSEPLIFQGRTQGKIVCPRGPPKFGWDPIFEYEGQTYAEMDKEKKNSVSHRGKALQKFKEFLETYEKREETSA